MKEEEHQAILRKLTEARNPAYVKKVAEIAGVTESQVYDHLDRIQVEVEEMRRDENV